MQDRQRPRSVLRSAEERLARRPCAPTRQPVRPLRPSAAAERRRAELRSLFIVAKGFGVFVFLGGAGSSKVIRLVSARNYRPQTYGIKTAKPDHYESSGGLS